MPKFQNLFLVFISCLFCFVFLTLESNAAKYVSVALIGATGDLAKKYLWHGFFQAYKQGIANKGPYFLFYGCARANKTQGEDLLMKIIDRSLTCYNMECESHKRRFITAIRYVQLKTEDDFESLNHFMSLDEETYSPDTSIAGRIFYVSIPPNMYPKTTANLYKCCRPLAPGSWQRLVLERPFGSDHKTAEMLAQSLSKWFNENEIYRVDHYLQKAIVRHILPFRLANANWLEPILNRHFVDRVEVVSKEILGVKGRTKFYNQVGVVRDMLQSHLTELLTLITMELPSHLAAANYAEIQRKKIDLIEEIKPVDSKNILFAQYKDYMQEAVKDGINKSSSAKTATFAAAQVQIQSARWKNVPFILVAGKQLDEKATYVRVIFKRNTFRIPYPAEGDNLQQIVFHIAYGTMKEASILVSKTLAKPTWPPGIIEKRWEQPPAYDAEMSSFYMSGPEFESDAYCEVIKDIIQGRQSSFVGTSQLLSMWHIWQPVLNILRKRPMLYTRNSSLDFFVYDNRLQFMADDEDRQQVHIRSQQEDVSNFGQVPSHFRGGTLYVNSTTEVAIQLALSIINEANVMIKRKKSFHIGFSGGKTPALLLAQLRERYPLHLWLHTHVWLVDDRCQHLDSHRSNFNLLYTELLQHVNIPYINIHPMPVSIAGALCLDTDEGDVLYEKQLTAALGDGGLDYTVLGLGKDGHIASLFPYESSLRSVSKKKVILTNSANRGDKRMSLSKDFINLSQNIAVMVTGKEKHSIMNAISSETDQLEYPVLGVQPTEGQMSWYVDLSAWLGA